MTAPPPKPLHGQGRRWAHSTAGGPVRQPAVGGALGRQLRVSGPATAAPDAKVVHLGRNCGQRCCRCAATPISSWRHLSPRPRWT